MFYCWYLFAVRHQVFDFDVLQWKYIGNNESIIDMKPLGIRIGPGNITLWGKYPFVYGFCSQGVIRQRGFLVDLNCKTLEWFEIDDAILEFDKRGLDCTHLAGIGGLIASPRHEIVINSLKKALTPSPCGFLKRE